MVGSRLAGARASTTDTRRTPVVEQRACERSVETTPDATWWVRGSLALAPQPPTPDVRGWSSSELASDQSRPPLTRHGGFEARWRSRLNHRHPTYAGGRAA